MGMNIVSESTYCKQKKIAFIDTEFYVYNFNQESITKKIGVHHWDTWKTWFNLEKLAQKHNYEKKLIKKN